MTLSIGQKAKHSRTFSQADFDLFARLSRDDNPIHVDPQFASRTRFGRTLAHGMMLFSVISGLVQESFAGAQVVDVELMFPGPTYVGDAMQIRLEVESIIDDGRAIIAATVSAPEGEHACMAKATVVMPPPTPKARRGSR